MARTVSVYIKRKIRFPDEITHKRNTDRLGLGLSSTCKAQPAAGEKLRMVTALRAVTCRACIEITAKRRAAARARTEEEIQ